jgi:hypothetical protein
MSAGGTGSIDNSSRSADFQQTRRSPGNRISLPAIKGAVRQVFGGFEEAGEIYS